MAKTTEHTKCIHSSSNGECQHPCSSLSPSFAVPRSDGLGERFCFALNQQDLADTSGYLFQPICTGFAPYRFIRTSEVI